MIEITIKLNRSATHDNTALVMDAMNPETATITFTQLIKELAPDNPTLEIREFKTAGFSQEGSKLNQDLSITLNEC